MSAKKMKKIRKSFKSEKELDVLGPADRRVSSSVEKNVYVTDKRGEQTLTKVSRNTMVNVTKSEYRRTKKELLSGEK